MVSQAATLSDVMQAIQALSKDTAARNKKASQRFPHVCRNGASCKFLACGSCWFQHDELHRDSNAANKPENNSETDYQKHFQALEAQIANVKATIDKRLDDLSDYVDRCLACFEEKLGNEEDTLEKDMSVKLDKQGADKFKLLFAKMDKRMDQQLEHYFTICLEKTMETTREVTGTFVEGAMKTAAKSIDGRLQKIEARLARDAEDNG